MKKQILAITTCFISLTSMSQLTFVESELNGTYKTYGVCVSPDDAHVYCVNYLTVAGDKKGITAYTVNGNGSITQLQELWDDGEVGGTIPGMNWAKTMCMAPDGENIYVAAHGDDGIKWFDRNTGTGILSDGGFIADNARLDQAFAVVASPDNGHVYVTSPGRSRVVHYTRDAAGDLTYSDQQIDGVGSVTRLSGAKGIAISPGGKNLYVTGANESGLVVFDIDAATGNLTFNEEFNGLSGLSGGAGVVVSPDATDVYVAGQNDDRIAHFRRDVSTGKLTYQTGYIGGSMDALQSIAISPDGEKVVVSSSMPNALNAWTRNTTTGALVFQNNYTNGVAGVINVDHCYQMAFSTNGHFYAGSYNDNSVTVFSFAENPPVTPLSIEMTEFDGFLNSENQTELYWETIAEVDNHYFSVQRSGNGSDFEEIGTVGGNGSTSQINNYDFVDPQPLKGISYYQIVQFDYDGKFTRSKMVAINNSGTCGMVMYPNLVENELFVLPGKCGASNSRPMQISVFDVNGRLVKKIYNEDAQSDFRIDMNGFTSGAYIVSVNDGQSVIRQKILKR